jgi:CRP/FNR family transcriptional regulator, cyclic AMP receptor protein
MLAFKSQNTGRNPPDSSSASRRALLRRSPMFSHLTDNEADAILAEARIVRYGDGALIFTKGDPGNSMMAVLRGQVAIGDPSPDGRHVVLTVFREGDVFGEMALLDGKERSATATAAAECELLVVPRLSFLRFLERRPDACLELMVLLCERLRRTNEQVEDLAFLTLERRVAKLLLRLADEAGPRPKLKISQRALAELVGGSRERINKLLQQWKHAEIIATNQGSIQICDREALVDLA